MGSVLLCISCAAPYHIPEQTSVMSCSVVYVYVYVTSSEEGEEGGRGSEGGGSREPLREWETVKLLILLLEFLEGRNSKLFIHTLHTHTHLPQTPVLPSHTHSGHGRSIAGASL